MGTWSIKHRIVFGCPYAPCMGKWGRGGTCLALLPHPPGSFAYVMVVCMYRGYLCFLFSNKSRTAPSSHEKVALYVEIGALYYSEVPCPVIIIFLIDVQLFQCRQSLSPAISPAISCHCLLDLPVTGISRDVERVIHIFPASSMSNCGGRISRFSCQNGCLFTLLILEQQNSSFFRITEKIYDASRRSECSLIRNCTTNTNFAIGIAETGILGYRTNYSGEHYMHALQPYHDQQLSINSTIHVDTTYTRSGNWRWTVQYRIWICELYT